MGAGPRGRGETRTRGGSDGGGILDEAAFRSPRRGRPKQSAGEGTSELELAAAKIEPEPEPLRAPAIVAFLTRSPAVAGRAPLPAARAPGRVPRPGETTLLWIHRCCRPPGPALPGQAGREPPASRGNRRLPA